MGIGNCCEVKKNLDKEIKSEPQMKPNLLCFVESGNERQKNYALKIKDNFTSDKTILYEIKSIPKVLFSIKFIFGDKVETLQNSFDDSEEAMNETLKKAYEFLRALD